jgi:hypothetical protein
MPNRNKQTKFDGPIPGENFTSDVRNYPWHRPPDNTDYVQIVDRAIHKLNEPERTAFTIALLETGETIVDIVTGMTRIGVARGKMSIDMAILAAGPIARMIETIAEKAGIDYERGWEQEPRIVTAELLRAMGAKAGEDVDTSILEDTADVAQDDAEMMGLMAQGEDEAPADVQSEMLGDTPEDEEEEIV